MADDAFERTLASKTSRLNERAREISEQTFWKESSVRRYGRETKEVRVFLETVLHKILSTCSRPS